MSSFRDLLVFTSAIAVISSMIQSSPAEAARLCADLFRSTGQITRDRLAPQSLVGKMDGTSVVIERRFDPVHQFSFIVPTYRELYNGNIARLLQAVQAQKIDPAMVEVVFVVNNTPAIARNLNNPIRVENQKTLAYLAGLKLPFRVRTVDLSSEGIETNMGILRQRGSEFAIRTSKVDPNRHVILHMDADTVFEPSFLPGLYDLYSNYAFGAVFVQRRHTLHPEADEFMMNTFYKFKFGDSAYKMDQAGQYALWGVATPQISSRASALLKAEGFPPIRQDEDFRFTTRLGKSTKYFYSPDLYVTALDRARPDGFDAKIRHQWNSRIQTSLEDLLSKNDPLLTFSDALESRLLKLHFKLGRQKMTPEEAVADFQKYASWLYGDANPMPGRGDTWDAISLVMNHYGPKHGYWSLRYMFEDTFSRTHPEGGHYTFWKIASSVTERESGQMFDAYAKEADRHDLEFVARKRAVQNLLGKRDVRQGLTTTERNDIFIRMLADSNSVVHRRVIELARNQNGFDGVMTSLMAEYPDWMRSFNDTPSKSNMLAIRLSSEFLLRGHNDPTNFPGLARFYTEIERPR